MSEKSMFTQDPLLNPGGAVMEIFFSGQFPEGAPLPSDVRTALGASLIEAMTEENVIQKSKEQ